MRGLWVVGAALMVPWSLTAQSVDEQIAEAVLPAPESLKAGATIIIRDAQGEPRVIRRGTNSLVCEPSRFRGGVLSRELSRCHGLDRQALARESQDLRGDVRRWRT